MFSPRFFVGAQKQEALLVTDPQALCTAFLPLQSADFDGITFAFFSVLILCHFPLQELWGQLDLWSNVFQSAECNFSILVGPTESL